MSIPFNLTFESIKEAIARLQNNESDVEVCGLKIVICPWLKSTQSVIVNDTEVFLWSDACDNGSVTIYKIPNGPSEPAPMPDIQFY